MELGRGSDGVREEVGFINASYLNILYWPRPKAKRTCVAFTQEKSYMGVWIVYQDSHADRGATG